MNHNYCHCAVCDAGLKYRFKQKAYEQFGKEMLGVRKPHIYLKDQQSQNKGTRF